MKIKVSGCLVELDGDEMTRILWKVIREKLILPFVDIKLEYYDLGLPEREATKDQVTIAAAKAIGHHGVGVKCATITANAERVEEYKLSKAWSSPNGTIRALLDGTVFRKPILVPNIKAAVRSWKKPITIGRHAYGDIYKAVEVQVPQGAEVRLSIHQNGKQSEGPQIHDFSKGAGMVLAMHNTEASVRNFAKACIAYALDEKIDIWFATKDTISRTYHGRFREIFDEEIKATKATLDKVGIRYSYYLIDDVAAQIMKHEGGILWACMNYDGDVFSDMVASGFSSLGMMSSVLVSPSGAFEYEAAHGTVKRHYLAYREGLPTSTNPVATIFAWSGALRRRGHLDVNPKLQAFADKLEAATLGLIAEGIMTKDLLPLAEPPPLEPVETMAFIDKIIVRLEKSL